MIRYPDRRNNRFLRPQVYGVGAVKLEKYGNTFLELIRRKGPAAERF